AEVEQHDLRLERFRGLDRPRAVELRAHLVAHHLQQQRQALGVVLVVVRDQDAQRLSRARARTTATPGSPRSALSQMRPPRLMNLAALFSRLEKACESRRLSASSSIG